MPKTRSNRRVVAGIALCAWLGWAAQPPDFSGVWTGIGAGATPGGKRNSEFPKEPPVTAQGAARLAKNLKEGDPVETRCWPLGPTRFMRADSTPLEIVRTPEGFAMLSPRHYMGRRIYTDGRPHPTGWDPPQYMGHAVGKWEAETLVVDTAILNDKTWLNESGWPHTDEMRLTERLRLIENGKVLEDQITIEDPKFYTKPLTATRYWRAAPKVALPDIDYSCLEKMQDKIVVSK